MRSISTTQADTVSAPSRDTAAALVFSNVWRHWGRKRNQRTVLAGVDLNVHAGTITCIQGRNGVGKTTLLRIASGILAADAGLVAVYGTPLRGNGIPFGGNWRDYHSRIGFLSAGDRGLYARLSVRAHLEYWVRVAFLERDLRGEAIEFALRRFDLTDLADRRADRLSQGQRQRLRLALTTVHRPSLLLLDEPRNSLDDAGSEMLTEAVMEIVGGGGAVVWCSPFGEEQPVAFDQLLTLEEGMLRPQ